jgi:predicted AlkP superfamily phosphohydrolase/phosphomutase
VSRKAEVLEEVVLRLDPVRPSLRRAPGRRPARFALCALAGALLLAGCSGRGQDRRVLVIGLDGATWNLIEPWLEDGTLPQIAALRAGGASGPLESVRPTLSPPAWTSAVTGANPGKHGIFDFQRRLPGQLVAVSETSRSRRMPGVWSYLGAEKKRSCVINIPMTAPPEPLLGYMISGFPHLEKYGYTYPPELQQRLGNYILDEMGLEMQPGQEQAFRDNAFESARECARVSEMLYREGKWDLFWTVFTGTDRIQHYFWKFIDPRNPYYDAAEAARWGPAVRDFWKMMDDCVGRLVALADERTTVFLISDHGFGPVRREFRVQNLLRHPERPGEEPILWTYSLDVDASSLYFSRRGREPNGFLDDARYPAARDEVERRLLAYVDPETGVRPVARIVRAENEYAGLYLSKAPDLILVPAEGYWIFRGDEASDFTDPVVGPPSFTFSAWHETDGVIIAAGPGIGRGTAVEGARLVDIAPTVLYAAGAGIPDGLDGRVLESLFEPGFRTEHPVRLFTGTIELPADLPQEVKDNLKSLPYVR